MVNEIIEEGSDTAVSLCKDIFCYIFHYTKQFMVQHLGVYCAYCEL